VPTFPFFVCPQHKKRKNEIQKQKSFEAQEKRGSLWNKVYHLHLHDYVYFMSYVIYEFEEPMI
jgi:hypothetical protein